MSPGRFWLLSAVALPAACFAPRLAAAEPPTGYLPRVTVSAATRLDWTFPLANQSPVEPPADWLPADYDSARQEYEAFVPPAYHAESKKTWPVMLFVSAVAEPAGWTQFQPVAEREGVIFASPCNAGNECPMPQRVRIVLDVLDDLRRKYHTDPDRTYLGGFSGGGRVACSIVFALPECFGGAMPACAGGDLREEPWLRHRAIDRLSVALLTGSEDFNRGEVERYRGPLLEGVGVRTRVAVQQDMGHAIPNAEQLGAAFAWLEEGVAARRKRARLYPAMRVADEPPSREAAAEALLEEARARIEKPKDMYRGLMLLSGLSTRWPDVPAAEEALAILHEYDARQERPWEEDDLAEQRTFLLAQARALDGYASGPLSEQYEPMRKQMLEAALELWQQIVADRPRGAASREGTQRIAELQKLLSPR